MIFDFLAPFSNTAGALLLHLCAAVTRSPRRALLSIPQQCQNNAAQAPTGITRTLLAARDSHHGIPGPNTKKIVELMAITSGSS